MLVLLATVVAAGFGERLAPADPFAQNLAARLLPPVWIPGGRAEYFLGTDQLGRDTLSRIIAGARVSVTVGVLGVLLGTGLGTAIGVLTGFYRGATDAVLMRVVDSFLAVPIILLAILLAIQLGPGVETVVIAAALLIWARTARVVRAEVLTLRERPFIEAARAVGSTDARLMRYHILPNLWGFVITVASLQLGTVILLEASLSFLGGGVPPPTPAWGSMIAAGRQYLGVAWWVATIPGIAVFLLVLSSNLMGDWVRDRVDPRLRA